MIFKNQFHHLDAGEYREWLIAHCGPEFDKWSFSYWKFDLIYGVAIADPEIEILFRLRFNL